MIIQAQDEFTWNRWEKRIVDCLSSGKKDDCVLVAPDANPPRDPKKYKYVTSHSTNYMIRLN
ncbi:hypothetical protein KIN20_033397 [Parelaphostrongylus tenuis]|uniref:Uncharacterized protein n=1 Tax=Parelaphostrongylus tenuis TaxID=148309 RepID=A0AAD5RA92_PARTN|nr:hypothetical protein KIN20_033397 [Parelaphostrongylus tenuis]